MFLGLIENTNVIENFYCCACNIKHGMMESNATAGRGTRTASGAKLQGQEKKN